ncbi:MAG: sulfatase-like hydrolase/transferase [Planctomycetota bacterium]|jgi:arylsulfatase A-like enzyme|nr:sulfatase-like hydrolase/transferase [Planctomycetota bacterium]MDP6763269.1 sulfatase-like hydrolase/transferase [Planctomycetota bacterium]MDP6988566.1 sulfatase-like hydrolase/transferase [Planctomycetota bacterium]
MHTAKPKRPAALLSVALFLGSPSLTAAQDSAAGTPPAERPASVLLVTLGTTRADRLGCYGHEGAETPALDGLAAGGARFERAYAHVPQTLPAHASLMTGLLPFEHGIHIDGRAALGDGPTTLAERFAARGYRTGGFASALVLERSFGLARGFEVFDDTLEASPDRKSVMLERKADAAADAALAWLREDDERPFFCWVHFRDANAPHRPPRGSELEDPYDGELAFVDSQLARLLAWADEAAPDALVIAVGDHGESLGEHGEQHHGMLVNEAALRIPLVVRFPGRVEPGLTVPGAAGQVDLVPTVGALLGWPAGAATSGRSLAGLLAGEDAPGAAIAFESELAARQFGLGPLHGVLVELEEEDGTRGLWKLVRSSTHELFRVDTDPGEEHDLFESRPERAEALVAVLERVRARPLHEAGTAEPDMLVTTNLAGIVDAVPGPDPMPRPVGDAPHPRTGLGAMEDFELARRQAHIGNAVGVNEPLGRVAAAFPDSPWVQTLYASVKIRLRGAEESLVILGRALELDDDFDPAHHAMARTMVALRDPEMAMAHLQIAVELRPANFRARLMLAQRFLQQRAFAEALEEYRQITLMRPQEATSWWNYSRQLQNQRQWAELSTVLQEGAALCPEDLNLTNYCSWILATNPLEEGRNGELAFELARRNAEATEHTDPNVLDSLAAAQAEMGLFEEAAATAEAALLAARQRRMRSIETAIQNRKRLYESGRPFRLPR